MGASCLAKFDLGPGLGAAAVMLHPHTATPTQGAEQGAVT